MILDIIAVALGAVACILSLVAVILIAKNRNTSQNFDIDEINENLKQVSDELKTDTGAKISSTQEVILNSSKSANAILVDTVDRQMRAFGAEIKELAKQVETQLEKTREELKNSEQTTRNSVSENLAEVRKEFRQSVEDMRKAVTDSLKEVRDEMKSAVDRMSTSVTASLKDVREDNNVQLSKIRETVDEKLTSTLDNRVKLAFAQVSDRLEAVQRGFGEMKELSDRVGNLNRVFTNVKTRGNWGEVALESLLEQILAPEQYKTQFMLTKTSKEMVDFAIVMPGQAGETVYLPIDAKFPLADYERLVEASDKGNQEAVLVARKALFDRVKQEAKSIRDKYIKVPVTTNFAILYVPNEGLYAELMRDGAFCSDLQSEYRVTVCGPTTIAALLNSLQTGFTTLKIQKRSGEIIKQMKGIREDFVKFGGLITKIREKAEGVVKSIDDIDKRNGLLTKKLNKVGGDIPGLTVPLSGGELLEIAATEDNGEGTDES